MRTGRGSITEGNAKIQGWVQVGKGKEQWWFGDRPGF